MNPNEPAFPVIGAPGAKEDFPGLTKRELAGILLGEPIGIPEIDAMIKKANRRKIAMAALPELIANSEYIRPFKDFVDDSLRFADTLLEENR